MKAPAFSLKDQNGENHTLEQYKGKWVVLYFYPKVATPGCTKEACAFRDGRDILTEYGAVVLGVSKDSVESHKKFADKHNLSFTLLSDPEAVTIKAYGAWGQKKFMGKTYDGIKRNTYLISPEGELYKTYENVNPITHIGHVLTDLKNVSRA